MSANLTLSPAFSTTVSVPTNSDPALADRFYNGPTVGLQALSNNDLWLLQTIHGPTASGAGTPNTGSGIRRIRTYADVATIGAIAGSQDGDFGYVIANAAGITQSLGLFRFTSPSSASVDNVHVLNGVGGKWIRADRGILGVANGVATLDGTGQLVEDVPVANLVGVVGPTNLPGLSARHWGTATSASGGSPLWAGSGGWSVTALSTSSMTIGFTSSLPSADYVVHVTNNRRGGGSGLSQGWFSARDLGTGGFAITGLDATLVGSGTITLIDFTTKVCEVGFTVYF